MTDTFAACLAIVLKLEGGFANLSSDPGGATNLGVTRKTWEGWTGKAASIADIKALTPAKVAPLYRERYWDTNRCGDMPPALALCVFDASVNMGAARAAKYLQALARVSRDGVIGAATIAAVGALVGADGLAFVVKAFQQSRRDYYRNLNTFSVFGRGWLARVDAVETAALRMIP